MANINDNIRGKKLFKQGSTGARASKGSDGEFTVSKEISDDLNALTDISDIFNDDGLYQINRYLIKQLEDVRADVEELHAFIKDAFGKDSSNTQSAMSHCFNSIHSSSPAMAMLSSAKDKLRGLISKP